MTQPRTSLEDQLDPGEQLVWSGQPKQGLRLQITDVFLIPFSLMWGGFAFFWEASVLGLTGIMRGHAGQQSAPPLFFAIWGVPFCLVGLYMILGRFFVDAATRRKTWYGLTDRRLIIARSFVTSNVTSFDLATLANLNLVELGDRSGDILIGTPFPMAGFANTSWPGRRQYAAPGFYLVPEAREVFNQIRAVQARLRK